MRGIYSFSHLASCFLCKDPKRFQHLTTRRASSDKSRLATNWNMIALIIVEPNHSFLLKNIYIFHIFAISLWLLPMKKFTLCYFVIIRATNKKASTTNSHNIWESSSGQVSRLHHAKNKSEINHLSVSSNENFFQLL
jgi:hypothetical protein